MRQEYVYQAFNRFWHWGQAVLILFLAVTGFEIHGSLRFFGFAQAVKYHSIAAIAFLVLVVFAIFWHFTTGQWRQYLPTLTNLRAQADYYLFGIFRNAPHPTNKSALSKLNPLQRLVYLGLKLMVIPVLALSGMLYMFYRYPQRFDVVALKMDGLRTVALVHTAGAFLVLAFLIAHLYLITTGTTLTSNLKAMITGYEEVKDDPHATHESRPQ
jgi:thiosulfate reductase cytochrome b subunit